MSLSKSCFISTLIILILATLIANATKPAAYTPIYSGDGWEIDVVCEVYKVVDGDTFDCFPVGRVRLADVNAPELSEPGGDAAKQALTNLVSRYGPKVYLDVDDWYVMDRYNRVVAVAYLRYNKTHLLNVNKWLLNNGYAEIMDYRNEFDPYTWALYVYYPVELESVNATTVTKTTTSTKTVISTLTTTRTTTSVQITTEYSTLTTTRTATISYATTVVKTITITATTTTTKTATEALTQIIEKTATKILGRTVTETVTEIIGRTKTVTTTIAQEGAGWSMAAIILIIMIVISYFVLKVAKRKR